MSETIHEYIVTHVAGTGADTVKIGQSIFTRKYEGKERTWEIVSLDDGEWRGSITGLHRRKTERRVVELEFS